MLALLLLKDTCHPLFPLKGGPSLKLASQARYIPRSPPLIDRGFFVHRADIVGKVDMCWVAHLEAE